MTKPQPITPERFLDELDDNRIGHLSKTCLLPLRRKDKNLFYEDAFRQQAIEKIKAKIAKIRSGDIEISPTSKSEQATKQVLEAWGDLLTELLDYSRDKKLAQTR